jgi:hypothetical protein
LGSRIGQRCQDVEAIILGVVSVTREEVQKKKHGMPIADRQGNINKAKKNGWCAR